MSGERESLGCVFGIAIGLVFLAALLSLPLSFRRRQVDSEAHIAALFRDDRVPEPFALAEATRLPSGETLVHLVAHGSAPDELFLIEYGSAEAAHRLFEATEEEGENGAARVDQEASLRLREWEKNPTFEWRTVLQRDEVQWGSFRAPFIHERAFTEEGTWRDAIRVNLTQPGRNLVLFVMWPWQVAGKRDALEDLLERIEMRPIEKQA